MDEAITDNLKRSTRTLTITSHLRTGHHGRAQVVIVRSDGKDMVAKIYDPMYYSDVARNKRLNVIGFADADYSHEVAAYKTLQDWKARSYIPKYYGGWTVQIPTPDTEGTSTIRMVRMILMQHVEGTLMGDVDAEDLSKKAHNTILRKAIEAESIIFHAGVAHNDIRPHNIIILGSDFTNKRTLRVVIIDFNIAVVRGLKGLPLKKET